MRVLKFLFIILFSLFNISFTIIEDGTVNKILPINEYGYETITYIDWKPSEVGYWTQNSRFSTYNDFDMKITRSKYPTEEGLYYYDFWFYSQSYYWNGIEVTYTWTNIRNITVYVDGNPIVSDYTPLGITFFDTFNAVKLRFKTKSLNPFIWIEWKNMNAI